MVQGRFGESDGSINRLNITQGKAIMDPNHQGTRVGLTLNSKSHRVDKDCVDYWSRVCRCD